MLEVLRTGNKHLILKRRKCKGKEKPAAKGGGDLDRIKEEAGAPKELS